MKPKFLEVLKAGAIAGAASAVINAVLFFIFHAIGFIDDAYKVAGQPEPISVLPVVFSSFISSILASVVYFLFLKFSHNGFKNFRILALVLLVLSFAQAPILIPNVPILMTISLNILHTIVVASLLYFFKKVQAEGAEASYQTA